MSLEKKLLRILYDNFQKTPNSYLSGKDFVKESGMQLSNIYKKALYLKGKGYIEIEEINEIGRSGPLDIRMKITTVGIDYVKNCFFGVMCKWIVRHLKEIIVGVIITVIGGIVLYEILKAK